ncbi:MAG: NUDIX hydrolase [Phycisphaeraceae bacterium]|nr:NUDIX hydrolase [Phycisphaeraceae bacterium]
MAQQPTSLGTQVFEGRRFQVHALDMAGPDGRVFRKEVVVHPGAVVILPLLDAQTVVLIRNERVAVGQTLWELPAGTLESGEEPLACAWRELIEETGYRAGHIAALTDFYTSPGICTERMWAFVARDLAHVGQQLDENEHITPEPVAMTKAMDMLKSGDIRDGKTLATLLYYDRFGGK